MWFARGQLCISVLAIGLFFYTPSEAIPHLQNLPTKSHPELKSIRNQKTSGWKQLLSKKIEEGPPGSNEKYGPDFKVNSPLRVRGGISQPQTILRRENTMLALKKYFSQLHLFPLSKRKQSQASTKRTMLHAVKWKGLILAVISFSWIMLRLPGGELEFKGVPVPAARRCLAIV